MQLDGSQGDTLRLQLMSSLPHPPTSSVTVPICRKSKHLSNGSQIPHDLLSMDLLLLQSCLSFRPGFLSLPQPPGPCIPASWKGLIERLHGILLDLLKVSFSVVPSLKPCSQSGPSLSPVAALFFLLSMYHYLYYHMFYLFLLNIYSILNSPHELAQKLLVFCFLISSLLFPKTLAVSVGVAYCILPGGGGWGRSSGPQREPCSLPGGIASWTGPLPGLIYLPWESVLWDLYLPWSSPPEPGLWHSTDVLRVPLLRACGNSFYPATQECMIYSSLRECRLYKQCRTPQIPALLLSVFVWESDAIV